jgi:hypothetical protein
MPRLGEWRQIFIDDFLEKENEKSCVVAISYFYHSAKFSKLFVFSSTKYEENSRGVCCKSTLRVKIKQNPTIIQMLESITQLDTMFLGSLRYRFLKILTS